MYDISDDYLKYNENYCKTYKIRQIVEYILDNNDFIDKLIDLLSRANSLHWSRLPCDIKDYTFPCPLLKLIFMQT